MNALVVIVLAIGGGLIGGKIDAYAGVILVFFSPDVL